MRLDLAQHGDQIGWLGWNSFCLTADMLVVRKLGQSRKVGRIVVTEDQ